MPGPHNPYQRSRARLLHTPKRQPTLAPHLHRASQNHASVKGAAQEAQAD